MDLLSIQILQYEFLGPIPLHEWGPPMEKLVYLILLRSDDKFSIYYVGDCDKTDDPSFFTQHPRYKCWTQDLGSKGSLHLAILPLFESSDTYRKNVVSKIMNHYKPFCNSEDIPNVQPEYSVRTSSKADDIKTDDAETADTKTETAATSDDTSNDNDDATSASK